MALLPNSLWYASCLPSALAFRRATYDVASVQRQVLQRVTGYSDVEQFRDRFALTDSLSEPEEPVLCHVPTSGTTGATKWVPYTKSLLGEFQAGIAPWVVDLYSHHPSMLAGKSYWAISPVASDGEAFSDDTAYLGRSGWLARLALAVPPCVRKIRDMETWRSETVRHLMDCRDLTFISVWHPSFLTLLLEGVSNPARLWPRLRVISCWGDSPALREMFPQAEIQSKGLIATEAFVSLPLCGQSGAALAVRSHFFEFMDEDGGMHLAHELLSGRTYTVVVTTGGGLRRYRLHDGVRVVGHMHACPRFVFTGKQNNVSDHFGEKVSESHIRDALAGVQADFVMVACEGRAYTVYVEGEILGIAEKVEAHLLTNVHYRYCRELGQLRAVRAVKVPPGAQQQYLKACRANGQRLGDIKPVVLHRESGWHQVFGVRSFPA